MLFCPPRPQHFVYSITIYLILLEESHYIMNWSWLIRSTRNEALVAKGFTTSQLDAFAAECQLRLHACLSLGSCFGSCWCSGAIWSAELSCPKDTLEQTLFQKSPMVTALLTNTAPVRHTLVVISTPQAGRGWPCILIVAYLLVSVYKCQCFLLNMQQVESGAADCS